jgi:DNA-binding PucR family transcriptional regulator
MYKYLIIEYKKQEQQDDSMIISLFSEFVDFTRVKTTDHQIILFYEQNTDISFKDVILNVMSDTLTDLRLYASHHYVTELERDQQLEVVRKLLKDIQFAQYFYLDDKILLKHNLNHLTEELKKYILRKFTYDQMMLNSIKVYLESNQNSSVAAKNLYIHRNTLIQRLDKFKEVTGFDVRDFNDAFPIYHLIK